MSRNTSDTATIWAPLAQVRISERRSRSVSQSTVERYRSWLEQGREPPPVRLAHRVTATSFGTGVTASPLRWPQDTPWSRLRSVG